MARTGARTSKQLAIIVALTRGDLVVMPTDTVFGILASALDKRAVARLYRARGRNPKKPCIILLARASDAAQFGVYLNAEQERAVKRLWPGSVTVVFRAPHKRFAYLHRGTRTLAFRVPGDASLRQLIRRIGPLIAPSANPEGLPVASSALMAQRYFGASVAYYVAGRPRARRPSGLLDLTGETPIVLRSHPALKDFRIDGKAHTMTKWTNRSTNVRSSFTKSSKEKSRLKVKRGR